jgi:hypothetical protein
MHLTYHDPDEHASGASIAKVVEAGAPGMVIEITPEMLRAAVESFCGYEPSVESPLEAVVDILEAMWRVHQSSSAVSGSALPPSDIKR